MPVQNELCGILLEDFLSIWKLRAVFLSGMLAILFGGGERPWCAGIDGGGFLSIWNLGLCVQRELNLLTGDGANSSYALQKAFSATW